MVLTGRNIGLLFRPVHTRFLTRWNWMSFFSSCALDGAQNRPNFGHGMAGRLVMPSRDCLVGHGMAKFDGLPSRDLALPSYSGSAGLRDGFVARECHRVRKRRVTRWHGVVIFRPVRCKGPESGRNLVTGRCAGVAMPACGCLAMHGMASFGALPSRDRNRSVFSPSCDRNSAFSICADPRNRIESQRCDFG